VGCTLRPACDDPVPAACQQKDFQIEESGQAPDAGTKTEERRSVPWGQRATTLSFSATTVVSGASFEGPMSDPFGKPELCFQGFVGDHGHACLAALATKQYCIVLLGYYTVLYCTALSTVCAVTAVE